MKKCILSFILILSMVFCSVSFAFGAADPKVAIVNPVSYSSVTSTNLLVSVKITQPKTVKVSVSEIRRTSGSSTVSLGESDMKAIEAGTFDTTGIVYSSVSSENFKTTNNLSFYTKKLENVNPGVYLIKVDTISQDKVIYSSRSYVTVKSKAAVENKVFDSSQSGTAAFLQGLIKSIFGN